MGSRGFDPGHCSGRGLEPHAERKINARRVLREPRLLRYNRSRDNTGDNNTMDISPTDQRGDNNVEHFNVDNEHKLDELSAALFRTAHNYDHHSPSARLDGVDNIRTILAHYLRTGNVLAAARPADPGHQVGQSRHSLRYAT